MKFTMRSDEILLLLGLLLALPSFALPIGVISGFEVDTQPIYLFKQGPFYKIAMLFPVLSILFLWVRRTALTSIVTVFCHAALSVLFCVYIVFLYFRFHFATPDPRWVALTFLGGCTLLFLGHLKIAFFPYEFLRTYQPGLPVRLQRPPSPWEIWGALLLLLGALIGFQGYYAGAFLGQGRQYLLIIAGTIELTPMQRVQTMLGTGLMACICGLLCLFKPKKNGSGSAGSVR